MGEKGKRGEGEAIQTQRDGICLTPKQQSMNLHPTD